MLGTQYHTGTNLLSLNQSIYQNTVTEIRFTEGLSLFCVMYVDVCRAVIVIIVPGPVLRQIAELG